MNNSFLANLAELVRLLPQIRELCQRQPSLQEAIVTRNDDPTGFRRIKATRQAQGGQSETDWLPAGRASMYTDEPIPEPGTHILLGLVDGDPHKPFMLRTLSNATNPPDDGQLEPTKDNTVKIPGNERYFIEGNRYKEIAGEHEEVVKENCYLTVKGKRYVIDEVLGEIIIKALAPGAGQITIQSDVLSSMQSNNESSVESKVVTNISSLIDVLITAGTSIVLTQGGASVEMKDGAWKFNSQSGQSWEFGDGDWIWNAAGGNIRIINANDVKINGKSVAVVGALDDDGDLLINKGY